MRSGTLSPNALLLGVVVAIWSLGCFGQPRLPDYRTGLKLADVSGTVKLDGQPVANARVVFELQGVQPTRSSYGETDENGYYVMYKERGVAGVQPGPNLVRITGGGVDPEDLPSANQSSGIPAKYNRRSELMQTVEPNGDHTFDFELTSK